MASLADKREALALLEAKHARRARNSLDAFVRYIEVPGAPVSDDEDCEEFYPDRVKPADHHRLIIDVLERVERGEIRRVMLFLPPGSAKSTYASVVFPPWYMGRNPRSNIIAVSYASDLAKKFGRRCRSIVRSREYQNVFGVGLTGDNAAVDDWSLDNQATYMAGGILSGITGNRADAIVIDDPVKGREDADSEVIRNKTWDAFLADIRSRLKPRGALAIIQTRWHEDDLSGRILPEDYDGRSGWVTARDGEQWFVLNLPAQCVSEDDPLGRQLGEWLWTDWFTPAHWEAEKRAQSPRNWSALYQQRPSPEEGDYFKSEWLRWYEKPPARTTLKIYGASDYATKEREGDWTVHGVVGVDPEDNIYVLDWWRGRSTTDIWIERLLDLAEVWKPLEWGEEKGQILNSVGPFLEKRMRERKVYFYRRQFPSVNDKPTRAQSIRGRTAMGKVYLPRNAPWATDLIAELMAFPNGRTDDQVDVLGTFGRMLDHMVAGKPETKPKPIAGLESLTLDKMFKSEAKRTRGGMI